LLRNAITFAINNAGIIWDKLYSSLPHFWRLRG